MHGRVVCNCCGKVIRQCRCVDHSVIRYELCESCKRPAQLPVQIFTPEMAREAEDSQMYGVRLGDCSRDELLAVITWMYNVKCCFKCGEML